MNLIEELQDWTDEIVAHVESKEDKEEVNQVSRIGMKKKTIASQAKTPSISEITCQLCEVLGHSAKNCDLFTKLQARCNYCKEEGHWVKDCPRAKRKDEKKKKIAANQATKQELPSSEGSEEDSSDEDVPPKGSIRFIK